jgi:hypothetical protein
VERAKEESEEGQSLKQNTNRQKTSFNNFSIDAGILIRGNGKTQTCAAAE